MKDVKQVERKQQICRPIWQYTEWINNQTLKILRLVEKEQQILVSKAFRDKMKTLFEDDRGNFEENFVDRKRLSHSLNRSQRL